MAVLTRTRLETHPDGTVGVVGIIGSNWSRLETIFDPALASSDLSYNIFVGALIRDAVPTTNGAVFQWRETGTKKIIARPGTGASASPILDLSGARKVVVSLAADPTFSTTNRADGWEVVAIVKAGGSTRALTFPGGWVFVGAAAPATLASGKTAVLELWCNGTAESDIVARWTVQP